MVMSPRSVFAVHVACPSDYLWLFVFISYTQLADFPYPADTTATSHKSVFSSISRRKKLRSKQTSCILAH